MNHFMSSLRKIVNLRLKWETYFFLKLVLWKLQYTFELIRIVDPIEIFHLIYCKSSYK